MVGYPLSLPFQVCVHITVANKGSQKTTSSHMQVSRYSFYE